MLRFHRVNEKFELPTFSLHAERALKGVTRSHVITGTPKRVRRSTSSDVLLGGQGHAFLWDPVGRVLWVPFALGNLFGGEVRRNLRLVDRTGIPRALLDKARRSFLPGGQRLTSLNWLQAASFEVHFRSHKGDQAQQGSGFVRTRDCTGGPFSGVEAGGGAVALRVELLSGYPVLPESAPCRRVRSVKRLECGCIWRRLRQFGKWWRTQGMIPAKSASTHCPSVQPLRWQLGEG